MIDLYSCACIIQSLSHFCLIFFSITVDFVIPQKGESLLEAYEKWRKWADEKGTSYTVSLKFTRVYKVQVPLYNAVAFGENIIIQSRVQRKWCLQLTSWAS